MSGKKDKEKAPEDKVAEKRLRWAVKSIGDAEIPSSLLADIIGQAEGELEKRSEDPELVSILEIKDDIERASKEYGKMSKDALSTGLNIIDKMIGGLKPGEVTLVAANSNQGKSFLASCMAVFASSQAPILFISLEMRAEILGARMKIYLDKMFGEEVDNWAENCDIYFQKAKTLDYRNIKKLFEKAEEKGVKAVFLDYLQYLGVGMEQREMAKISRMFHELALVYNIPIVIVASLRKDSIINKRKWFQTDENDVSGVGAIVYDCDNLLTVGRTNPENDEYTPETFWVKHIKSRCMPVDKGSPFGKLKWDGGAIFNDDEWWEKEGKFYGQPDRPTVRKYEDSGNSVDSRLSAEPECSISAETHCGRRKTTTEDTETVVDATLFDASQKAPVVTDIKKEDNTGDSWLPDDKDIKEMTEFERRKLGLY